MLAHLKRLKPNPADRSALTSRRSLTAVSSMVRSVRKIPRYGTVPWALDWDTRRKKSVASVYLPSPPPTAPQRQNSSLQRFFRKTALCSTLLLHRFHPLNRRSLVIPLSALSWPSNRSFNSPPLSQKKKTFKIIWIHIFPFVVQIRYFWCTEVLIFFFKKPFYQMTFRDRSFPFIHISVNETLMFYSLIGIWSKTQLL